MKAPARYTTQLQAGLGMISETLALLEIWEPGILPAQLAARAVEQGLFSRATARRARNLAAEMFAPRYLADGGVAASRLKFLYQHGLSRDALVQLCLLFTARAQSVFADFVIEVYWPKYSAGALTLSRSDAERFVNLALDSQRMTARWSEGTVKRVSGYLIGCCVDFNLLEDRKRGDRRILRFSLRPEVALYLAHDLHFSGMSDAAIVTHRDWLLFGFQSGEVLHRLKTLSQDGHFVVQSSGELVQISWKYQTMDECLYALAQG